MTALFSENRGRKWFVSSVTILSLCLGSHSLLAQNEPAKGTGAELPQKSESKFIRSAEPARLPLSLPGAADSNNLSPLDLLPSFPPGAQETSRLPKTSGGGSNAASDVLDFVLHKRANPSLIPDGPNPTEDAAVALNKRHRYQSARAQAQNDPDVREALLSAQKAHTDRELREAMRTHYTLLFALIRKLDPSLESLIKEREVAAFGPLNEPTRAAVSRIKK